LISIHESVFCISEIEASLRFHYNHLLANKYNHFLPHPLGHCNGDQFTRSHLDQLLFQHSITSPTLLRFTNSTALNTVNMTKPNDTIAIIIIVLFIILTLIGFGIYHLVSVARRGSSSSSGSSGTATTSLVDD